MLTDIHLLWTASFLSSTRDPHDTSVSAPGTVFSVVTNDARADQLRVARQFVVTETLSEFCLLPGDRKMVSMTSFLAQHIKHIAIVLPVVLTSLVRPLLA